MSTREGKQDAILTGAFLLILVVLTVVLATDLGRGLDATYVYGFLLFFATGIIGILALWAWNALSSRANDEDYEPLIFDSSRPLSSWLARGIVMLVLFIIFAGGAAVSQEHSFVPIINPYDSAKLINPGVDDFSTQGTIKTAARSGAYPGFAEETLGFVFTSALTLLLLFGFKRFNEDARSDKILILLCALISSVLWGLTFATAHESVYGLDTTAYWRAAVFGTVNQFANQLTGAPVSVLPHFGHNALLIVSFSILIGFSIIKAAPAIIPLWGTRMNRRGNVTVIASIIGIILLILAIAWVASDSSPLSTLSPACTDWTPNPELPACGTDTDCTSAMGEIGENVKARCNGGTCEIKLTDCYVENAEVAP